MLAATEPGGCPSAPTLAGFGKGGCRACFRSEPRKTAAAHQLVVDMVDGEKQGQCNVGERTPTTHEICSRAMVIGVDIYRLRHMSEKTNSNVTKQGSRWCPPPADVLKINLDGAFIVKEKMGAWGFVDGDGQGVLLAGLRKLSAVHDALSAEGEVCLVALKAAMEVGISWLIIENDSANFVSAVHNGKFDQAPGGIILLSLHFGPYQFHSVSRSSNRSAHELAQAGLVRDPGQPLVWFDPSQTL